MFVLCIDAFYLLFSTNLLRLQISFHFHEIPLQWVAGLFGDFILGAFDSEFD